MPVLLKQRFRPNIWECQREIGNAVATMPDGRKLIFADFEIAPTLVINKVVQPCVQFGYSQDMDQLHIDLPAEPVRLGVAQPMRCVATLTLHTGEAYTGIVVYPESRSVRTGFGQRKAAPVTATGEVSLP